MMEHTQINNLHAKVIYMGKTLFFKYSNTAVNVGVYPPSCISRKFWVGNIYFTTFHVNFKGKIGMIEQYFTSEGNGIYFKYNQDIYTRIINGFLFGFYSSYTIEYYLMQLRVIFEVENHNSKYKSKYYHRSCIYY